jgi:hypothetical protein
MRERTAPSSDPRMYEESIRAEFTHQTRVSPVGVAPAPSLAAELHRLPRLPAG